MSNDISDDWNLGPDNLYPTEKATACKLDDAVKLKTDDKKLTLNQKNLKIEPVSLFTKFKQTVQEGPEKIALAAVENGSWKEITYERYWQDCTKAAKSFMKLGLKQNQCVAIIGFNAPPWMISLHGAIFAGGIGCGIYTTNSADACEYVVQDCGARIVVVENQIHLEKFLKCIQTGLIDGIVQYTGDVENNYNGLVKTWSEFIEYGKSITNEQLEERISRIAPNKCATLIYTSGTTGQPKAVMISHDNIVTEINFITSAYSYCKFEERIVSFLPLSHIVAQVLDCFASIQLGATVYFATPDVFKGTLTKTLAYARPTAFFAVPRVWEKLEEKITENLANLSKTKARMFKWARNTSLSCMQNNSKHRIQYKLADKLVLSKIKKILGFDKTKILICGAAPITKKTLEFFMSLGMVVYEAFGMSESTAAVTISNEANNRFGSVGPINSCNRIVIMNKDKTGVGEICMQGRSVFMGYLNSPSKTQETIDSDGFLHSGDLGRIDEDGFLFITGRIKELIITAGGENVAPIPIEDAVKEELLGIVSNCMVVGDKKKFLTILITLKSEINLDTLEPTDNLTNECINLIKKLGSKATKVSQIFDNKADPVYNAISSGIQRANQKAISNVAKLKKFAILPRDFSLPGGELGNTFKLRRAIVLAKYTDIIEKMYASTESAD